MKLAITILALLTATSFAQGPLAPPGAPAPTMKTLDEIHTKVVDVGERRTPISSLPFTIDQPGSYYLTGNLSTALAVDGISIDAKNVTIDLNGFRMTGNGAGRTAISITNANVTTETLVVKNGAIAGWYTAIDGNSASIIAGSIEGVHIRGGYGIQLKDAKNIRVSGCVLDDCLVDWNGVDDFVGTLMPGANSVVSDCRIFSTATSQTPWAIAAFDNSLVRDCVVRVAGNSGILCLGGIVRDCAVNGSSPNASAISASNVEACTVRGAFRSGVAGSRVRGCHIELTGDIAQPNGCFGITGGLNSRISDCTVSGPPIFIGVRFLQEGATVDGVTVTGFGTGISTVANCAVRSCKVQGALSTNILAGTDCKIMDCQVANAPVGINAGARCVVSKNEVRGTTPGQAIGMGILVSSGGSVVIEANEVVGCATGISVSTASNMVSRNTLRLNTTPLSIVGGNEVGPTGTPSIATSPFTNLVY